MASKPTSLEYTDLATLLQTLEEHADFLSGVPKQLLVVPGFTRAEKDIRARRSVSG